ncbi:MAG: hypothetical protein LUD79_01700 [Oscillospiraceae bacterium]|nr:hypothetical protein [Oscillospiraceae bacterium]
MELEGWMPPRFDDSGWGDVCPAKDGGSLEQLVPNRSAPVREKGAFSRQGSAGQ